MTEKIDSVDDFVENLSDRIYTLTRHVIIPQLQNGYLNDLKANLPEDEVMVLGDFAENYSIIIQSFYWNNQQLTLHHVVVYHKEPDKEKVLFPAIAL